MMIFLNRQINADPRFNSPAELDYFMSDFEYIEFDRLMSPEQVFRTESGSCHDQVMFEYDELSKQGVNPRAKFLISVDDDGNGGETHSFVYYSEDSTMFWFEQAWQDYAGIHDFATEQEMFDFIIDAFINRNPNKHIYIADFIPADHTVGEDLQTLVDICMESAVEV